MWKTRPATAPLGAESPATLRTASRAATVTATFIALAYLAVGLALLKDYGPTWIASPASIPSENAFSTRSFHLALS